MPYMDWKEEFAIGIKTMDRDHNRLVGLLNEAHAALEQNATSEAGLALLDGMEAYAATHFDTEERLMARFEFPDLEVHRRQHEFFCAKVRATRKALSMEDSTSWREDLFRFLSNWLAAHILGEDRLLGEYLRGRGVH